jgi:hypothetical protein
MRAKFLVLATTGALIVTVLAVLVWRWRAGETPREPPVARISGDEAELAPSLKVLLKESARADRLQQSPFSKPS